MRIGLLLAVLISVVLARSKDKYEVLQFDYKNPHEAGQGDFVVIFLDDKSVKAGRIEKTFYAAIDLLQERDDTYQDEVRDIHFIHWDTTIKQNKKYQKKWFGEIEKKVNFPDIVIISEKRKNALDFQVWGGMDNDKILMEKFDEATAGRLFFKTCDEIDKEVKEYGNKAFVFFGDPALLLKDAKWKHVREMAYHDRKNLPFDPILFIYNNEPECMTLYGADENVITLASLTPGHEPVLYHVSVDEEDEEVDTFGHLKRWVDHAFMWKERDWTLRQIRTFEGTSGFMLAYLPQKEAWDFAKKQKIENDQLDRYAGIVGEACEELHQKKAPITCSLAPLDDPERDAKMTPPMVAFPKLKEYMEGTPIYVFAKNKQTIHQFPVDMSLPENYERINFGHLLLWTKYWQTKDQILPNLQKKLYSSSATASLGLYDSIDNSKKELKSLLEKLEAVGIQVRKKKEPKNKKKKEEEAEEPKEEQATEEKEAVIDPVKDKPVEEEEVIETIEL